MARKGRRSFGRSGKKGFSGYLAGYGVSSLIGGGLIGYGAAYLVSGMDGVIGAFGGNFLKNSGGLSALTGSTTAAAELKINQ